MANAEKILVVDDDPVVRKLLSATLSKNGYAAAVCSGGAEALELIGASRPDLMLLDIMMPEMDGYEVLRRLDEGPAADRFPVILLTSRSEASQKVQGFNLGAADYVAKPFDRRELLARIRTQLRIRRQEKQLREYAQNLEQIAEERTLQLLHVDRLASLGALSAGICHEINNAAFIMNQVHLLRQTWDYASRYLEDRPAGGEGESPTELTGKVRREMDSLQEWMERINQTASRLQKYSRKKSAGVSPVDINRCAAEALELAGNRLKEEAETVVDLAEGLPLFRGDAQQIAQVVVNLLLNAVESGAGRVRLRTGYEDGKVLVAVQDDGRGMDEEVRSRIFDPFYTTTVSVRSRGLGLSIAKGIVEDHGGEIEVRSVEGAGSEFIVHLPAAS